MTLREQAAMIREERASVVRNLDLMYPIQRAEYDLATAYAAELDDTPIDAEWIETLPDEWHQMIINVTNLSGTSYLMVIGKCINVATRGEFLTALRLMGVAK